MPEQYKIKDIENMLGVTRDAVRYYSRKGLIQINKNDQNGYRLFDEDNINDILNVAYYRNALDMDISDITKCIYAGSIDDYLATIKKHQRNLEEQLQRTKQSLQIIEDLRTRLEWCSYSMNHYEIIECPACYSFPGKFLNDTRSNIFKIGYPTSYFQFKNDQLCYTGSSLFAWLEDQTMLKEQELAVAEYFPACKYLSYLFASEKDIKDPSLIEPIIFWAQEHDLDFEEPFYLTCCFSLKNNHIRNNYYEAFLVLK